MDSIRTLALQARSASTQLALTSTALKNRALERIAHNLLQHQDRILEANAQDMERARRHDTPPALLDRLLLTPARIEELAQSTLKVVELADPVGQESGWTRPNGLQIRRVKVPLGVIAMVYEARPNVTVDSAVLCLKAGNACLLRGSSHAAHSNRLLTQIMQESLVQCDLPPQAVINLEGGRDLVDELAQLEGIVDCLIPRGNKALIQRVKRQAWVPVIETGVGNCHLYVHRQASLEMARQILINGKTQRPGVCNALETLLLDREIAAPFLELLAKDPQWTPVKVHGCPQTCQLYPAAQPATEEDWEREYLALEIAVKVVSGLEEALEHIRRYSSGHSEAIVTQDLTVARLFQRSIDACAVYVNASTRFTDGGQFGFGAEIGISTQKLHARGPLGLSALTTDKYLVEGEGQIR